MNFNRKQHKLEKSRRIDDEAEEFLVGWMKEKIKELEEKLRN